MERQTPETAQPGEATKPVKIEEEYSLSIADAAAFLRELASSLQSGSTVEMGTAAQHIGINPQEPILLELSYKEYPKKMKKRLQINLEIEETQKLFAEQGARPKVGPLK